MLSNRSDIGEKRGWLWSPELLKTIRDIEFEWKELPLNSFVNSKIEITKEGKMTVFSGYIWDGATAVPTGKYLKDSSHLPVISLTSKPIPSEWYATLRHDACYEFMWEVDDNGNPFPYSRQEIDRQFYIDLNSNQFRFSKLYYLGVKWFGRMWKWTAIAIKRIT